MRSTEFVNPLSLPWKVGMILFHRGPLTRDEILIELDGVALPHSIRNAINNLRSDGFLFRFNEFAECTLSSGFKRQIEAHLSALDHSIARVKPHYTNIFTPEMKGYDAAMRRRMRP